MSRPLKLIILQLSRDIKMNEKILGLFVCALNSNSEMRYCVCQPILRLASTEEDYRSFSDYYISRGAIFCKSRISYYFMLYAIMASRMKASIQWLFMSVMRHLFCVNNSLRRHLFCFFSFISLEGHLQSAIEEKTIKINFCEKELLGLITRSLFEIS